MGKSTKGGKKTKVVKVDGCTRVELWVDGEFVRDLDTHSQLSVKAAKEILLSNS